MVKLPATSPSRVRRSNRCNPKRAHRHLHFIHKEPALNADKQNQIEAAVFRRLLTHLDEHKEVQNIDLMNLASFCRNCLSKWYTAACEEAGEEMDYETARERVYGMPYADWKARFQSQANADQLDRFNAHTTDT